MPSIKSFASFYSKHSDLFISSSTVDSQTGVQQGDPLGPIFVFLAISPLIDEIESKYQISRNISGISMTVLLQEPRSNFVKR